MREIYAQTSFTLSTTLLYIDCKFKRTVLVEVEILVIVVRAVSGGDRLGERILLSLQQNSTEE